jgi:hypothetical protein
MAYSQGGMIAAADYNNFLNGANQLNSIWSTGSGDSGYGQTAIPTVSQAGMVTAAQWAQMINTLNSVNVHQSGVTAGLNPVLPGAQINYLSSLSTAIGTASTNRLLFNGTQGSTTTGATFSPNFTQGNTNDNAAKTFTMTRTVAFTSGDAARYFFNAGGQLNFVVISVPNNDGTSRTGDLCTLTGTNWGGSWFRARSNSGRQGSSGTVNTNTTNLGYWNGSTSAQTVSSITSTTSGYTGDYLTVALRTNGNVGANGDVGSIIYFDFTWYSAVRTNNTPAGNYGSYGGNQYFNETINFTFNHRIDVIYPETTNISATWGTPTIS